MEIENKSIYISINHIVIHILNKTISIYKLHVAFKGNILLYLVILMILSVNAFT